MAEIPNTDKDNVILLTNGMKFDPSSGQVIDVEKERTPEKIAEEVANISLSEMQTTERRSLRDISEETKLLNACAVVMTYDLLGVPDVEQVDALSTTLERLQELRASREYTNLRAVFTETVETYIQRSVRGQFAIASHKAAKKMIDLMDSQSSDISQKAAKDVLDRAGHRPADVVEHRHSHEDELVIRVIRSNDPKTIDVSL